MYKVVENWKRKLVDDFARKFAQVSWKRSLENENDNTTWADGGKEPNI